MKLLSKSRIASEQAQQRKLQIDEGVKLATRIDALRRTDADIEAQHQKFIAGMKDQMESEIHGLDGEIKYRKREISELEIIKQELLKPLDAKWKEVVSKEEAVDALFSKIKSDSEFAEKNVIKASALQKKTKETYDIARIKEREITRIHVKAETTLAEAEKIKIDAEAKTEVQDILLKERIKYSDDNERRNDFDYVANNNFKSILDDREEELNNRERQINDKYETLLRTINRIKNG